MFQKFSENTNPLKKTTKHKSKEYFCCETISLLAPKSSLSKNYFKNEKSLTSFRMSIKTDQYLYGTRIQYMGQEYMEHMVYLNYSNAPPRSHLVWTFSTIDLLHNRDTIMLYMGNPRCISIWFWVSHKFFLSQFLANCSNCSSIEINLKKLGK